LDRIADIATDSCKKTHSASGCRLKHPGDFLKYPVHADSGIDASVNFVMVRTSVHYKDLSALMRLLDHVGQMMAILLGYGRAKDNEVKGIAFKSILHGAPANGSRHMMADLGHFGCLRGESLLFGLSIKNLDRRTLCGYGRGFLTSCGQWALLDFTWSLPSWETCSEITEEQVRTSELRLFAAILNEFSGKIAAPPHLRPST
jgi:hypothetical protein